MKSIKLEDCIDLATKPDTTCIIAALRCQCGRLIVGRIDDVSEYRFCPWCGRKLREKMPEYKKEIYNGEGQET